ncbi:MAG: hypothetical protein RQ899_07550 [Pseudomonadales bacterium]|nr:hypothetical protein [Pseudomonadales bacterium]
MKRLKIAIIDLTSNRPVQRLYSRLMNANSASLMPQAIAVWCEQLGHEVRYICYTGVEDLDKELPEPVDICFFSAYTASAQFAYALSAFFRSSGAVTVLGGPHARCYPEDAAFYFDYVLGMTDKPIIRDVLADGERHRPFGLYLTAEKQPEEIPGVRERWKFISATIAKTPFLKLIPMIGSTGCPYTCSFCIDAVVPYQALGLDQMREDLRFLLTTAKTSRVAWHDPNFGVRFNDHLSIIEEEVPPGRIEFLAESSLSLLSEPNLARLKKNGFVALLPGIESWYEHGNKSKTGKQMGMDKVRQVAEHVNTILRYVPYVQTNFVLGLDCDDGTEPFELIKRFLDLAPGAYPAFSLLTAYGRAAALNLQYQSEGRVVPVPFHFLNNTRMMNVRPKNYGWSEFFGLVSDLVGDAHSKRRIFRRFQASRGFNARWFSTLRAATSKKAESYARFGGQLQAEGPLRDFFEGHTSTVPELLTAIIRRDLGPYRNYLPQAGLAHDHLAYMKTSESSADKDKPQALVIPPLLMPV